MYCGVLQYQDCGPLHEGVCGGVADGIWMQYCMGLQVEL